MGTGPSHITHTIHLSKSVIIFSVSLAVAIAGIIFLVFSLMDGDTSEEDPNPAKLLDYKVDIQTKQVRAGEDLRIVNEITNMGTATRYDIILHYRILKGSEVVDEWEESKAVTAVQQYMVPREIPDSFEEGKYTLKVVASYDSERREAKASDTFTVLAKRVKPTCEDGKQNQGEDGIDCGGPCDPCEKGCGNCDDDDACTEDRCVDGECYYKQITPCCGNGICEESEGEVSCAEDCESSDPTIEQPTTAQEIDSQISELMKGDINEAADYCAAIEETTKSDYCFKALAIRSGNKMFCSLISSSSQADFCYLKFASQGDSSVCSKIENKNLKDACEKFKT